MCACMHAHIHIYVHMLVRVVYARAHVSVCMRVGSRQLEHTRRPGCECESTLEESVCAREEGREKEEGRTQECCPGVEVSTLLRTDNGAGGSPLGLVCILSRICFTHMCMIRWYLSDSSVCNVSIC